MDIRGIVTPSLLQMPELKLSLEEELAYSVDPDTKDHWDRKILGGVVPTEVSLKGPVDEEKHRGEVVRLASFQIEIVRKLFDGEWSKENPLESFDYFGLGEAKDLREITIAANQKGVRVVGFDTSSVACDNANMVFEEVKKERDLGFDNVAMLADIEFACQKRFIFPSRSKRSGCGGGKMLLSRILDVLDKQDKRWERKPIRGRKMARTARKIGKLLPFLEVLIIHPALDDNLDAIWGDTTPYHLETVVGFMQEGLGSRVELKRLGKIEFHKHIYTAALIRQNR